MATKGKGYRCPIHFSPLDFYRIFIVKVFFADKVVIGDNQWICQWFRLELHKSLITSCLISYQASERRATIGSDRKSIHVVWCGRRNSNNQSNAKAFFLKRHRCYYNCTFIYAMLTLHFTKTLQTLLGLLRLVSQANPRCQLFSINSEQHFQLVQ